MSDSKSGALTIADLQAIWVSAVDPGYSAPFIAAGEGKGLEAYSQAWAQYARVSQAIDTTTQACFILPWSGQTAPSASGGVPATVTLSFSRTKRLDLPMRLGAGQVFFEEQQNDWSTQGSVPVLTGRRFTLQSDVILMPGEMGPITGVAIAESVGYGYNNPRPGSIKVIDQVGNAFYHDRATVKIVPGPTAPTLAPPNQQINLLTVNEADTFVPQHVGQYVLFVSGANAGIVARITSFQPPQPSATPPVGSTVQLEPMVVVECFAGIGGTLQAGEQVTFTNAGTPVGSGIFVGKRDTGVGTHTRLAFVLTSGTVSTTNSFVGVNSAAGGIVTQILSNPNFVNEAPVGGVGGATWRILDWFYDLGLTVTNPLSPAGGTLGMLDGIGKDRGINRGPLEADTGYAKRVWQVADVVTPNAVKRALARVMGGYPWCFREVGSAQLPGIYYDRTGDPNGDYYDLDTIRFTNGGSSATVIFNEPVEYRNARGDVLMRGWCGSPSGVIGILSTVDIIRKSGAGTLTNPLINQGGLIPPVIGPYLEGLYFLASGAVINPAIAPFVNLGNNKRNSVYLDYTTMRAYFRVGIPRLGMGDFGFAFGVLPAGSVNDGDAVYDATNRNNFYDGYAVQAAALALRVYQALNDVKPGGVSFDLYIEDGPCT